MFQADRHSDESKNNKKEYSKMSYALSKRPDAKAQFQALGHKQNRSG